MEGEANEHQDEDSSLEATYIRGQEIVEVIAIITFYKLSNIKELKSPRSKASHSGNSQGLTPQMPLF